MSDFEGIIYLSPRLRRKMFERYSKVMANFMAICERDQLRNGGDFTHVYLDEFDSLPSLPDKQEDK